MAKRKHAAALFEVFNDHKSTLQQSRSASRGYGWWFKGRTQSEESAGPQVVDENDPTTMTIRSPLLAPRIAAVEAMEPAAKPVTVKSGPAPKTAPAPKAAPAPVSTPALEERELMARVREPLAQLERSASAARSLDHAPRFHLDRDNREVTVRLPMNSALIAAFGLILSVGVAYVIGRHIGNKEAVAHAAEVAAAQQQAADDERAAELRPSALEVPRRSSHAMTPPTTPIKPIYHPPVDDSRYHDRDSLPEANGVHSIVPVARPVTAPVDGPRIIGLNYLLVQNYPNKESAIEARDFLVQNGIACTVEKVPPGYYCPDPAWMSVITSRGFDKEELHAPGYEAFKRQIEKLGDKFAGNGKFKRFSIQPYKLK